MSPQNKISKVVIPVAGLGTRFLPVTKIVPKELLPVGAKPTLQIVIEEAVASGLSQVVLVTAPHKSQIESYFKGDDLYESSLAALNKEILLTELKGLMSKVEIISVFQEKPLVNIFMDAKNTRERLKSFLHELSLPK